MHNHWDRPGRFVDEAGSSTRADRWWWPERKSNDGTENGDTTAMVGSLPLVLRHFYIRGQSCVRCNDRRSFIARAASSAIALALSPFIVHTIDSEGQIGAKRVEALGLSNTEAKGFCPL